MKTLLLAAASLLAVAPVQATVLDFEDQGVLTGGNVVTTAFVTSGYAVQASAHLHIINNLSPTVSWNDSAWLGIHEADNQVVLTRQNGGAFALLSLQASEFFGAPNGTQVRVTGKQTNGNVLQSLFALDDIADGPGPLDDFQTITFGAEWQNLAQVMFQAAAGGGERWYALDNIVTTDAVPEPATWVAFITGFGILGAQLRRTRASRCAAAGAA